MGTFLMRKSRLTFGVKSVVLAGSILAGIVHSAIAAEKNEKNEKVKTPDVQIRIDPCIELMSIVFHLADNPEYNLIRMDSYAKDIEDHFGKYRDHEVVELHAAPLGGLGITE